jgi:hypothetical protein
VSATQPPKNVLDLDGIAPEAVPGVRVLPVVHARVDMAALVAEVLRAWAPSAVAVEVPTTLERTVERAVARLPRLSVILSQEPDDDEALIWLVAPGDPFVEALRWAREHGRPAFFVDPDVRYAERHHDAVPDPHALWELGPARYLELLRSALAGAPVQGADRVREAGMAYHVQQAVAALPEGSTLLLLVGAAHGERVGSALCEPQARPLARVARTRVELRHLAPDSLSGLLHDPPLAHAAWELLRRDALPPEPRLEEALVRKVTLERHGLRLVAGPRAARDHDERTERGEKLVALAAHRCSGAARGYPQALDRGALTAFVFHLGAASYHEQTQETVRPWQERLFFDFARRYARVQGALLPSLFEWVVAARGVGDDNLAWELFDVARTYPWQRDEAELPTVHLDGEELDLGTHKIRFRRRFFSVKQRLVRVPVREHKETANPDEWLQGFFTTEGLCSWPPEDLVVEDYGRFLQQKAVALLSAERQRTEPFSTSLLDGIDIRETMRNHHEGRIYVKELGRVPGDAGAVVVIFDRDLEGNRFPYCMTWLGEHDEESDMAFYATNPGEQIVGPGITRATYGGFMLTHPPGRVVDVWHDPDYRQAHEKADVLLMAALDYSVGKLVVHVGPDAPPERMRRFADARRKRLVHIPLGALSPVTLKRVRVVHLLAGRDKRALAPAYIW